MMMICVVERALTTVPYVKRVAVSALILRHFRRRSRLQEVSSEDKSPEAEVDMCLLFFPSSLCPCARQQHEH